MFYKPEVGTFDIVKSRTLNLDIQCEDLSLISISNVRIDPSIKVIPEGDDNYGTSKWNQINPKVLTSDQQILTTFKKNLIDNVNVFYLEFCTCMVCLRYVF